MKRTTALILTFMLLASLTLAGCSKQGQAPAANSGAATSSADSKKPNINIEVSPKLIGNPDAKIEITWQPCPSHSFTDSNKAKVDYLTAKAKAWAEKHTDVKILPIDTTININDSMAKILVQASEGRAPDVAAIDSYIFPNFAKYAQPLDDVLKEKGLSIDDWFPYAQKVMKPADKVLALWYTTDVRILYYRKDLIKNPPKTTDELIEIGKQMKQQGYDGYLFPAGRNESLTNNNLPFLWSQGGELVDDKGKPVFGEGKNKEAMLNWFKFHKSLIDSGVTPGRVVNMLNDAALNPEIASGKTAMFLGTNSSATNMKQILGDKFDQLWGIAPIPTMKDGGARTTSAGGWTTAVFTKDDQKRKLAIDFIISLYVDDKAMEEFGRAGGYLPVRMSVYDKSEFFKSDPNNKRFKEELAYGRVRPAAEAYPVISQEIQIAISNIITGSATPEKALDEAWNNVINKK